MTGNLNQARPTGKRIKPPSGAAGAGAFIAMVLLATALGGGAHATAPALGGAGKTSIASTAASTLATSVATPTLTATPYGGEGP